MLTAIFEYCHQPLLRTTQHVNVINSPNYDESAAQFSSSQTGSAAQPDSHSVGIEEIKRPGHEANHSPPPSAEISNAWDYTSSPLYIFMA
jgi:hypothetical protein